MTWENILKKPFDVRENFKVHPIPNTLKGVLKKYLDPYVRQAFTESQQAKAIKDKKTFDKVDEKIHTVKITSRALSGWPFEVLNIFSKLTKEKIEKLYNIKVIEFYNNITDMEEETTYGFHRQHFEFYFRFTLKED